jgi:transcriptional regulatory protein GAL4
VENRLQQLESIISHHLPGIDVKEALRSPSSPQVNLRLISDVLEVPVEQSNNDAREDTPENEALPSEASGFDWRETAVDLNELADGMASLSLNPSGKGYLGELFHDFMTILLTSCFTQDQHLGSSS